MNKRPTPEQDLDRLLDENGGEFAAIYRRLSRPEPPRRLDRVVLANAARAVHGARAPRAQRWALAMGSVTGVVLAAGIAWQVGQQMESRENIPEGSRNTQESRVVPVQAITEPRSRQKTKADLIMRDADLPIGASMDTPGLPGPMSKQNDSSVPASPKAAAPDVALPPPAPAPSLPSAPPVPRVAKTASPPASKDAQRNSTAPDSASVKANPAEMGAKAFPETDAQVLKKSVPHSERTQAAGTGIGAIGGSGSPALESRSAVAEPEADAASDPFFGDSLERNVRLPPAAWLKEIERLASSGQRTQAIENLRLFRGQYPDWPLPDALRLLDR